MRRMLGRGEADHVVGREGEESDRVWAERSRRRRAGRSRRVGEWVGGMVDGYTKESLTSGQEESESEVQFNFCFRFRRSLALLKL
jgi:hypothetical protein